MAETASIATAAAADMENTPLASSDTSDAPAHGDTVPEQQQQHSATPDTVPSAAAALASAAASATDLHAATHASPPALARPASARVPSRASPRRHHQHTASVGGAASHAAAAAAGAAVAAAAAPSPVKRLVRPASARPVRPPMHINSAATTAGASTPHSPRNDDDDGAAAEEELSSPSRERPRSASLQRPFSARSVASAGVASIEPAVHSVAKSFHVPTLLEPEPAPAAFDGNATPAGSELFSAIARSLPSPRGVMRMEDLNDSATADNLASAYLARPASAHSASHTRAAQHFGFSSRPAGQQSVREGGQLPPRSLNAFAAHMQELRDLAARDPTFDISAASARPASARAGMAPHPSAQHVRPSTARSHVPRPPSGPSSSAVTADANALSPSPRRPRSSRVTGAASRAWSVKSKIVQPIMSPLLSLGPAGSAPLSRVAPAGLSLAHLQALYGRTDDELEPEAAGDSLSGSGSARFFTPAARPTLFSEIGMRAQVDAEAVAQASVPAKLRPQTARPYTPAHYASVHRPRGVSSGSKSRSSGGSSLSKPQRPRSAATSLTPPRGSPIPPSVTGAPPSSLPLHSELLSASAGLWRGSPEDRVRSIYSRERVMSERGFERAQSMQAAAEAPRDREAEFALSHAAYVGASPAPRKIKDILTGEERDAPEGYQSPHEEPVDDEDDEDEAAAEPPASVAAAHPTPSAAIIAGGGAIPCPPDSSPTRVVNEDTWRDSDTFRSPRLRAAQLAEREAQRRKEVGGALGLAGNPGNLPAWESYNDYTLKSAEVAMVAAGGVMTSVLAPAASSSSSGAAAHVHFASDFIPAALAPAPSISAAVDAMPSVAAAQAAAAAAAGIGAQGSVRPLPEMDPSHVKSAARRRAEAANAERRADLEHARMQLRVANLIGELPIAVAAHAESNASATDASAAASPEAMVSDAAAPRPSPRALAAAERRRIKGTHYNTSRFHAQMADHSVPKPAPSRPASAHAALRAAAAGAYDTPAERVPLNGRTAGGGESARASPDLSRSQQGLAVLRRLAHRKAAALAATRAATQGGYIDASAAIARQRADDAAVRAAQGASMGLRVSGTVPRRPASARAHGEKKYFGRADVRQVHARVAAQKQADAEAQLAAWEQQQKQEAAERPEFDAVPAVDPSPSAAPSPDFDLPLRGSNPRPVSPIPEEEKQNDAPTVVPTAADVPSPSSEALSPQQQKIAELFGANSTHASRLRFLSSPRAARFLGASAVAPRAFEQSTVSAVRLANAPGRHARSAGLGWEDAAAASLNGNDHAPNASMVHFEPRDWTSRAVGQLTLHTGPSEETVASSAARRKEREQQRAVLVNEQSSSAAEPCLNETSASDVPPARHKFFPLRAAPILRAKPKEDADAHQQQQRGIAKHRPASAPREKELRGRELAAAGTWHSYAPAPADSHRPLSARGAAAGSDSLSSSSSSVAPPPRPSSTALVRAVRVVSFNDLVSTQRDVFGALAHHPDEARLTGNMWTPQSLITSHTWRQR